MPGCLADDDEALLRLLAPGGGVVSSAPLPRFTACELAGDDRIRPRARAPRPLGRHLGTSAAGGSTSTPNLPLRLRKASWIPPRPGGCAPALGRRAPTLPRSQRRRILTIHSALGVDSFGERRALGSMLVPSGCVRRNSHLSPSQLAKAQNQHWWRPCDHSSSRHENVAPCPGPFMRI